MEEKKRLKPSAPKVIMGTAAAVLVTAVIAYCVFVFGAAGTKKSISLAEKKAADGFVKTALSDLKGELDSKEVSIDIPWKMMELAMEHHYYDYADRVANDYLDGKEVSDEQFVAWKQWDAKLEQYFATNYKIKEIGDSIETIEDVVEAEAAFQALIDENTYDNALLYYAMSSLSLTVGGKIDYLNKAIETDDGYAYMSAELGNLYRRQGELEKAKKLLEAAYEKDKETAVTLRGKAVMEILEGRGEKALEYAKRACEISPEGEFVTETYIIALAAAGKTEEAEKEKESKEKDGYIFKEDTIRCMRGEITPEKYYIEE